MFFRTDHYCVMLQLSVLIIADNTFLPVKLDLQETTLQRILCSFKIQIACSLFIFTIKIKKTLYLWDRIPLINKLINSSEVMELIL
jgi:hypothetical protein